MENEILKKEIITNTRWNFFSSFLSKLGAVIFTILIARILQPEKYGIYNLAISLSLFFVTFADLGINAVLVKTLSYLSLKNKKKIKSYFNYLIRLKFILSLSFSLLLIFLSYPLSNFVFNKPNLYLPLLISGFYVFILSFENFFTSLFYVIKKVKYITIKETIFQLGRIFLALFLFYFILEKYRVEGLFFGLIFISLLIIIYSIFYQKKFFPYIFEKEKYFLTIEEKKKIKNLILTLTIINISVIFFSYIDTIMLGIFVTSEYIGYYRAAFSVIFSLVALFYFHSLFLPYFTQLKEKKLEKIINKLLYYSFILVFPVIFLIFLFSNYIIYLLFGYSYLSSSLTLKISVLLIIEYFITQLLSSLFTAKDKQNLLIKPILISTFINILLNYILITRFLRISQLAAINGAAIATIISRYFYLFFVLKITKEKLKINLKFNFIKQLIASLVSAIILFFIKSKIVDMNLIYGLLLVILYMIIYALFVFIFKVIKKEDIMLLLNKKI
ncbi:MAG: oligosaccharide flippase family protein [Candidatus Pacearchaeota archaeon]